MRAGQRQSWDLSPRVNRLVGTPELLSRLLIEFREDKRKLSPALVTLKPQTYSVKAQEKKHSLPGSELRGTVLLTVTSLRESVPVFRLMSNDRLIR